jgi:thioesterase domain-containing protein
LPHLDETINAEAGRLLSPKAEERLLRFRRHDDDIAVAVRAGDKHGLRVLRATIINWSAGSYYRNLLHNRLKPYDGRVVLFMPAKDHPQNRTRTLDLWRSVLRQEPETVDVPGTHATVVKEEGAETIGAWLSAEITRWAARSRHRP